VGQYSAVGIAIRYRPDSLGTTSHGGKIFHAHPDWSWDPPSLLYNGLFPGDETAGACS